MGIEQSGRSTDKIDEETRRRNAEKIRQEIDERLNKQYAGWIEMFAPVNDINYLRTQLETGGEKYWVEARKGYDENENKTAYDFTFGNLNNPNQSASRRIHNLDGRALSLVHESISSHENPICRTWRKNLKAINQTERPTDYAEAQTEVDVSGTKYGLKVQKYYSQQEDKIIYSFSFWNKMNESVRGSQVVWGIDDRSLGLVISSLCHVDNNAKREAMLNSAKLKTPIINDSATKAKMPASQESIRDIIKDILKDLY